MFLIQIRGNPALYVSNGIERRSIHSWEKGAVPLIEVMKRNGLDITVVQVANEAELDDVGGPLREEDQTKEPQVTEADERMETTPRESEPAGEHLAEPAPGAELIDAEIARLAAHGGHDPQEGE
jgi:hypothetical protein